MINKSKTNLENMILIIYFIILCLEVFFYSMLSFAVSLEKISNTLILFLLIIALITQKHTRIQWILFIVGSLICVFSFYFTHTNLDFLYMIIVAFSMSSINPKKILKGSIITVTVSLVIIVLLSFLNVIPNLIFFRDNIMRQSLGTIYPLAFAGFIFYICAALMFIAQKNRKYLLWQILGLVCASAFVFKVNGARNNSINILLLIIAILMQWLPTKINKVVSSISIFVVCILTFTSIFVSNYIPYTSNVYMTLNSLLSGRLQLQYSVSQFYQPKLWGQYIPQIGAGRNLLSSYNYFYIDNSYMRLLYMGGILIYIFFTVVVALLLYRMIKNRLYLQIYVLLIILLSGISEDALVNLNINIFIPLIFTGSLMLRNSFIDKNLQSDYIKDDIYQEKRM